MFFLINRFKLFIFLFLFFAILFSCGEAKAASYNANAVLGQTDYTHGDANQPNLTTGLNYPQGNVVDTVHHRLFVSDTNNNRVLVFLLNSSNNVISETPTYVIGQPNLSTVSGATTQNKLSSPLGLSYSAASNTLFVSDYGNTRIMVFDVSTSSIANGMNAIAVIGQTNFDSYDSYSYVPSEYSIGSPSSVEYDSVSNTLYVMDMGWNRITVYDINNLLTTSTPASAVIGQSSFTITGASAGQTRLSSPSSASFNSVSNTLYVTDKNNHRVLVFDLNNLLTTSTPASAVIGQANYTDNSSGVSQTTLNTPQGSAYNAVSNTLYVADSGNSRVLIYNLNSLLATSTPASAVIGEPNFDTGSGGLAQNLLYVPTGLSYNSTSNTLFINDYGNNRVVVFDGSGNVASAQGILGQPNYVNSAVNRANATNVDMNQVSFTAIDSVHHRLFVSDSANNRVLVFLLDSDNNVTTNEASYVIGQENFVSSGYAVSQGGLQNPGGLIYNSASNTLFVADYNNSRVMVFDVSTIVNGMNAIAVIGQADFNSSVNTASQTNLGNPLGMAFNSASNTLYVVENGNNRVTVFDLNNLLTTSTPASAVIGQADFISSSGSTSQTRLFWPKGAVYNSASNTLFVSEAFNQRITVFDLNNLLTTSTPASAVIGQADFISGTSGVSHTKLNNPYGLDYDSSENLLFVSDNSNNRVLSFDLNNLLTTSTPANAVIGQTNFDSNASATTQSGLYSPHGVSYNSANNSLYVADYNNNRVVEFNFVYFSNPSTLSTTTVGATYSTTTISAINNQSALSYSLFSGDLPTGLSFNTSTGVISGTSLVAGTSTFTLKASDTFGDSSEFFNKKMFTIASAYALSSVPSSVLAAANSATQITVSWSGDADSYYVENITASTNSGWVGGETEPSAVFSSLTCGTSYSFRVKGRNADNIETSFSTSTSATTNSCPVSGGSGGGGGGSVVSQPPIVSSQMNAVLVSSVDNQTVTLNFSVANAVQIAISEDQNFANSSWQLYASSKQFKLSAGNGQKIIYVKFRSVSGGETATYKVFVNSDTNKSIAPVVLNINKPDVVATSEIVNKFILSNPESKVVISPVKTITYKPNSIVAYNYSYKNESDKTQKVRIVRTLENGSGKVVDKASGYTSVLKDKTFKFKASSSLNSRLADGKYIVKVQILDFKTNKLLDQNSFEINVKKPILVKSAAKKR